MPIFFCPEHGAFGAGSKLCECLKKQLKKEREEIVKEMAFAKWWENYSDTGFPSEDERRAWQAGYDAATALGAE